MNNTRGIIVLVAATILGLGCRVSAIPIVTINDTTGPITVTGSSSFLTFTSATVPGYPEAVWWYGTVSPVTTSLGFGTKAGIWTEPGSSKVSDEYLVVSQGTYAFGLFLSDPSTVPVSSIQSIVNGLGLGSSINVAQLLGTAGTTAETGKPTQISPTTGLSVLATSSVPDGGSTVLLLGSVLVVMAGLSRRFARSAKSG
jgi:hypothetical protein